MGLTLAETILSRKLNREVRAGEIVVTDVDMAIVQDGTGTLTLDGIKELKEGRYEVAHPDRCMVVLDHLGPPGRMVYANQYHKVLREFCQETGAILEGVGEGISHIILSERYVKPGDIVVGADSHTSTAAGMAAFATGMGSTDVSVAMAVGKTWLRVPETLRFELTGSLPKGTYAKEIILHIIDTIGEDGAIYKAMEYGGDAVPQLSMDARFTITSMAQEAGAKLGLFPADAILKQWMGLHGRGDQWLEFDADPDPNYEAVHKIDLEKLEPLISVPHTPGNVRTAEEVEKDDVQLDQVFIGTCTNSRIEDLRIAAGILRGQKIAGNLRLLLYPGSKWVYTQALKEGLILDFIEAGAVIGNPACGPCPGMQFGLLSKDEICLASQNRNYKGRMGDPESQLYLGSPATCAASAIAGKIVDPRPYLP